MRFYAAKRSQLRLSVDARRQLRLRTLAQQALKRRWGALVACGDVTLFGVNTLSNLALSWHTPVCFSAARAETLADPVRRLVEEHQVRGYWCQALDLDAVVATLPVGPYPSTIAFLHLVGDDPDDLATCLERLQGLVTAGAAVVLESTGVRAADARAAVARVADALDLEATHAGHEDLACWIRPGAPEKEAAEEEAADAAQPATGNGFTVLTYPDPPAGKFARMCERAGYRVTTDPAVPFDLAVKWDGETYTPADAVLAELAAVTRVVNLGCEDISKRRVEEVHREVFGYGLTVDPRSFRGLCVKKANLNAQGRESVVECPYLDGGTADYVFQRLVFTPREPEEFEEYRVPITGPEIPCVVIKRRPVPERFDRSAGYAVITDTAEVFTPEEQEKILALCRVFGLDFGDLDVVRDRDDGGRLHVLDVNPTPGGPGGGYAEEQRQDLVARQLDAVRRVFVAGRDGVDPPQPSAARKRARS